MSDRAPPPLPRPAAASLAAPSHPPRWRPAAALAFAVLFAGVLWIRHAGREPRAWYPPCPLHATTGVLCPGCGSARTLHDLAHGDIMAAAGHNILIVAIAPLLAGWVAWALWRGLAKNLPPPSAPPHTAKVTLVVVVVFTVARNLPWWPWTLLAP